MFTYRDRRIPEDSVADGSTRRRLAEAERQGEPWRCGISPGTLREFLAARAIELIEGR